MGSNKIEYKSKSNNISTVKLNITNGNAKEYFNNWGIRVRKFVTHSIVLLFSIAVCFNLPVLIISLSPLNPCTMMQPSSDSFLMFQFVNL